jgi:4,5-DOPA dioxygenase extradiol
VIPGPDVGGQAPPVLYLSHGASSDPEQSPKQVIDGYWMGLAKRSIELV